MHVSILLTCSHEYLSRSAGQEAVAGSVRRVGRSRQVPRHVAARFVCVRGRRSADPDESTRTLRKQVVQLPRVPRSNLSRVLA